VAWRSVAALLLFPDALYLLGGYSESLFLALSCGALLAARRNALLLAGALAALATLTRLQGLVLLVPLLFAAWSARTIPSRLAQGVAGLILPPAALLVYQRLLSAVLGGGSIVGAFQQRWHITLQAPWSTIWQYVQVIRSPRWHLIDSPQANYVLLWDLLIGLLVLAVILAGARRLGRQHTAYALAAWCFALSRWYSTGRYMLAVLPFFIVVGLWAKGRRGQRLSIASLVLLVFFTAEFAQGSWVD
jgi:Gpi18-like mannosyltransferase